MSKFMKFFSVGMVRNISIFIVHCCGVVRSQFSKVDKIF